MTTQTTRPHHNILWLLILSVFGGALTLSLLGCGDLFCEVPEGTYKLNVTSSSGDCPDSIKNGIESAINRDELKVQSPENGCGDVTARAVSSDPTTGCDITATGSADGNEDGISNFDMTISVSGANCSVMCSHKMEISARK